MPRVVEESLEAQSEANPAQKRYADSLRSHKTIQEALDHEYKSILKQISGHYKKKE